jgi:hypothetical protein
LVLSSKANKSVVTMASFAAEKICGVALAPGIRAAFTLVSAGVIEARARCGRAGDRYEAVAQGCV